MLDLIPVKLKCGGLHVIFHACRLSDNRISKNLSSWEAFGIPKTSQIPAVCFQFSYFAPENSLLKYRQVFPPLVSCITLSNPSPSHTLLRFLTSFFKSPPFFPHVKWNSKYLQDLLPHQKKVRIDTARAGMVTEVTLSRFLAPEFLGSFGARHFSPSTSPPWRCSWLRCDIFEPSPSLGANNDNKSQQNGLANCM